LTQDADLRPAVFLDRDGVVSQAVWDARSGGYESPYEEGQVALAPGAIEGISALRRAGLVLVVVSNQPAAAKGTTTLERLRQVHDRVVRLLAAEGVELDDYRYCFHYPDGVDPKLSVRCACRKPLPGMLLEAAEELGLDLSGSWMVGDSDVDIEAGRSAGCRTLLVENPRSAHRRHRGVEPEARVPDLAAAAGIIVGAVG
jgi:D-glycero-D-manno-heptose 1,7-bisphosphate phosphatase